MGSRIMRDDPEDETKDEHHYRQVVCFLSEIQHLKEVIRNLEEDNKRLHREAMEEPAVEKICCGSDQHFVVDMVVQLGEGGLEKLFKYNTENCELTTGTHLLTFAVTLESCKNWINERGYVITKISAEVE